MTTTEADYERGRTDERIAIYADLSDLITDPETNESAHSLFFALVRRVNERTMASYKAEVAK